MLNVGAWEWIILAIVVLVFVGPEQLPSVIRRTGQMMGQVRGMSDRLRSDFADSMSELESAADPTGWAGAAGNMGPKRNPSPAISDAADDSTDDSTDRGADSEDGQDLGEEE